MNGKAVGSGPVLLVRRIVTKTSTLPETLPRLEPPEVTARFRLSELHSPLCPVAYCRLHNLATPFPVLLFLAA
jgi:hypothetical protein